MAITAPARPGRNEPCHCGSGRKYKQCCLQKDEAADRAAREQQATEAAAPAEEAAPVTKAPRHQTHQPWKAKGSTHGFAPKMRPPRKMGGG